MITQTSATIEIFKPQVGVGVIVTKNGKILLGKRKSSHGSGCYSPPGGHLKFKESVEACAKRELEEETGLVSLTVKLGGWTQDIIDEHKHYISVFAIVTEFEGNLQLLEPHKCESWDWYSWDQLPSPLFQPLLSLIHCQGIDHLKAMFK